MIQGIPMNIIGEYAEATKDDVPKYGIAQWLCEELLKCREQLNQGRLLPIDSVRQRFSFEELEPEINAHISLVWEDVSDCECIYTGLDETILPLPTHWYYVD